MTDIDDKLIMLAGWTCHKAVPFTNINGATECTDIWTPPYWTGTVKEYIYEYDIDLYSETAPSVRNVRFISGVFYAAHPGCTFKIDMNIESTVVTLVIADTTVSTSGEDIDNAFYNLAKKVFG